MALRAGEKVSEAASGGMGEFRNSGRGRPGLAKVVLHLSPLPAMYPLGKPQANYKRPLE